MNASLLRHAAAPVLRRAAAPLLRGAAALLLGAAIAAPALAAGDVKLGADLFSENCAECHSLKEGRNKKGPSLFASVGRKAGQIGDFSYSDALKASGITWTPEQLDAYLKAPKQAVPGGKMKYDGMAEGKDRADLIAYLGTVR